MIDESKVILQELYIDDPWKMMVGCILLNQTTRKQVDGVRSVLFDMYSTPEEMSKAREDVLSDIIAPLGLQNRRARTLKMFSKDWLLDWDDVSELYGIGKYAKDSWQIFVEGDLTVNPTDKVLLEYLGKIENGEKEPAKRLKVGIGKNRNDGDKTVGQDSSKWSADSSL